MLGWFLGQTTELGVWVDSIHDDWIVARSIPCVDSWNDPGALIDTGAFQFGEYGPLMTMVDNPVQFINLEVPREIVWRNIRKIFERLGIRVYVFRDRVEIRRFIPTEVIDIPIVGDVINRGAITPSP